MSRQLLPVMLMVLVLAAACNATPTPTPALAPTAVAVAPTVPPPTNTPANTPTALPPTNTPVPTATPTVRPTNTLAPTNTPVPTATPTVRPTDTPAPTPTSAPQVTVKTDTLNIRSGPGSNYPPVASAKQGDKLAVTGKAPDCSWLAVTSAQGQAGWVNGGADYVTLNTACAAIPAAAIPPSPTPAPPTATRPAAAPQPTSAGSLPPDKACYFMENFIGAELTVTLTKKGGGNLTFKVPSMGQYQFCIDPGQYTYTIDAPPPWGDINGNLDAKAGDRYRWPIRGQTS